MWYEYEGNLFRLGEKKYWYTKNTEYAITDVEIKNSYLKLPGSYMGAEVTHWSMSAGNRYGIDKIRIPASIEHISITNQFPDLEMVEVEQGNKGVSTDGKMLFSADGKELLYCLAAGNQESMTVPASVRKIRQTAFGNTLCKRIHFENPDVTVEARAFEHSAWIKEQGDYCIVGNMFYCLNETVQELRIPEGVRRFYEKAFEKKRPKHLITPILPPRGCIAHLAGQSRYYGQEGCEELTLTSPLAKISFNALSRLENLQAVHLHKDHKKYSSEDGIIFSKDRKQLLYYPPAKKDDRYTIPECVSKIGRSAFEGQKYLREIEMPDNVKMLGAGAFYKCKALQKVRFSNNIKEIPDDSVYQRGGVFEGCGLLREAVLPEKLQYLGSYAFYKSGLEQITLNQKLRQMGEYALAAEKLREISLPAALERLGKGALFYAQTVHAYVGTAKGLVGAVNTVPPGESEKMPNVEWARCMVYAHHRSGSKTEQFFIPGSIKRSAACFFDMAWNNDEIDYEEYDACFEMIGDAEEKLEFAELGILRIQGEEDTPFVNYMRRSALKIATRLMEAKKEKEFLAFLQRGYLSDDALAKLLKFANKNGLTISSAYILKCQKDRGKKKKGYSL